MKNPKIIFFGSSKYSVIDANALNESFGLTAIVTTSDKPKGRKRELAPSPPKIFGLENSIPVITADEIEENLIAKIRNLKPDFLVVADYGHILPGELLKVAKFEALNIHHSLLPKYRGPTPAPSAILAGETETGVSIIKMTADVDAGPIYAQEKYKIKPNETTDSLLTTLNALGGQLVVKVIKGIIKGKDKPKPQSNSPTEYTEKITKQNGKIDLENPPDPQTLDQMIRAYYPWPTVWCTVKVKSEKSNGKEIRIKLLPNPSTELSNLPRRQAGPLPQPKAGRPLDETTQPFLIQPEGKKPMTIKEFLNGYPHAKKLLEKLLPIH